MHVVSGTADPQTGDEDGTVDGTVDVRRRAEAAEARFRAIVEAAPDATLVVDGRGRIQLVNRQAERVFGYRREELVGEPVEVLLPERFRSAHAHHRATFASSPRTRGMGAGLDLHGRRRDGSEFPVEISLSPLPGDGDDQVIAAIRDVTDRRRATADQALLAAIVASTDDAIFSMSLDGEIRTWNGGAERLYGYLAAEVVGRRAGFLVPDSDVTTLISRLTAGERVDHHETVHRRKDGQLTEVAITASLVRDPQGRPVATSVIARDVTELRRARHALEQAFERERQATDELRTADKMKDEFLDIASHELRTPLTAIAGFATLLLDGMGEDRETRDDLLHRLARNASDMGRMIERLLDFSRLQAGRVSVDPAPLVLREVVAEVVGDLDRVIESRTVEIDVRADLRPIADVDALRHILANLLTNAAKFTGEGGRIVVAATAVGGVVEVSVTDDGVGIPDGDVRHVFERFYQGGNQSHGKRGAGIGLSIVRRYVELLGGRVWAEHAPGQGARFVFTLPAATEPVALGGGR